MSEFHDRGEDAKYTRVYKQETPDILKAFTDFDGAVFAAEGREIPLKFRELIALGVAITTRCEGCMDAHVRKAMAAGASKEEIAEALGVAIALNAGAAFTYALHALDRANE